MTSSSARAEVTVLAIALAITLCGCAAAEVEETQVVVVAETEACAVARRLGSQVNAYQLFVLQFTPGGPGTEPPCIECVQDPERCPVVRRKCVCGPARPPATVTINEQLQGVRFFDVPPERPYCVGIIGFDVPGLVVEPAEAQECDCGFGVDPTELEMHNRICGVTPFPTVVEENAAAAFLTVDCRPGCPTLMGR